MKNIIIILMLLGSSFSVFSQDEADEYFNRIATDTTAVENTSAVTNSAVVEEEPTEVYETQYTKRAVLEEFFWSKTVYMEQLMSFVFFSLLIVVFFISKKQKAIFQNRPFKITYLIALSIASIDFLFVWIFTFFFT